MSYSIVIHCRCWEAGLTPPPPTPVHRDDDDLFSPLPDDHFLEDGRRPFIAVDEWKETACAHKHMYLVHEWVANTSGMSSYRWALEQVDPVGYAPVLQVLPRFNDDIIEVEEVPPALAALRYALTDPRFDALDADDASYARHLSKLLEGVFAVAEKTGERVHWL